MGRIAKTYLRYGVPSNLADKYEEASLSVSTFRNTSKKNLIEKYSLSPEEIAIVHDCVKRQPIEEDTLQLLLANNNCVCCCCKGVKSIRFIVHHIVEYNETQDNSYENLAVLCLDDHDLAHKKGGLSSGLSQDQIKKCKESWEQEVRIYNQSIASGEHIDKILMKLPRYS